MHQAELARLLPQHLVDFPAEDRRGLRRPALHVDVGGPFDHGERRVLDVRGELLCGAPQGAVRALQLAHLERAREEPDDGSARVAVRTQVYREPHHAAARRVRVPLVVDFLAGERAPDPRREIRVVLFAVELEERLAVDALRRRVEPRGERIRGEADPLVAVDIRNKSPHVARESGEERIGRIEGGRQLEGGFGGLHLRGARGARSSCSAMAGAGKWNLTGPSGSACRNCWTKRSLDSTICALAPCPTMTPSFTRLE